MLLTDSAGILFHAVWNRWHEYVGKKKKKKKKNKEEALSRSLSSVCTWRVVCVGSAKDYAKTGVFLGPKVKPRQGLMVAVAVEVMRLD